MNVSLKKSIANFMAHTLFALHITPWLMNKRNGKIFLLYHNPNPTTFESHLNFLKKHYKITPVSEALSSKNFTVSITLDDAYQNNYAHIFPLLKKHSVNAMVFVTTGFMDSIYWPEALKEALQKTEKKYLELKEYGKISLGSKEKALNAWHRMVWKIIEMPAEERDQKIRFIINLLGVKEDSLSFSRIMNEKELCSLNNQIELGSHTVTHPNLISLSEEETQSELKKSKQIIEKITLQKCAWFAYPFGKKENYSKQTVEEVKKAGFDFAFTAIPSFNAQQERFELGRIGIGDNDSVALLCLKLTPVWPIFWKFS